MSTTVPSRRRCELTRLKQIERGECHRGDSGGLRPRAMGAALELGPLARVLRGGRIRRADARLAGRSGHGREARANPDVLAKKTLNQIADHTTEVIVALGNKPASLGHSTGGLLAQMLAGDGLSVATVAIDPGVFRGVLPLPLSALKVAGPFLINPAWRGRAGGALVRPVQVRLGERARREGGEGALRDVPRRRLRHRARADGQRQPQPVDGIEGGHEEAPTVAPC